MTTQNTNQAGERTQEITLAEVMDAPTKDWLKVTRSGENFSFWIWQAGQYRAVATGPMGGGIPTDAVRGEAKIQMGAWWDNHKATLYGLLWAHADAQ